MTLDKKKKVFCIFLVVVLYFAFRALHLQAGILQLEPYLSPNHLCSGYFCDRVSFFDWTNQSKNRDYYLPIYVSVKSWHGRHVLPHPAFSVEVGSCEFLPRLAGIWNHNPPNLSLPHSWDNRCVPTTLSYWQTFLPGLGSNHNLPNLSLLSS
jgi:hypothetical protein